MHPPSWICRDLHRLHPQLRLAWAGRPAKHEDELNPGSFALVQLYHISDIQDIEDPTTFRLTWDLDPVEDEDGTTSLKRIDRGPIFAKDGSTRRDWDSAFRVPVFVATLDEEYGFSVDDVTSGRFLEKVEFWLRPIEKRLRSAAEVRGKELESKVDDIAGEIADATWHEAKKHDSATVIQSNKHSRDEMAEFEGRKERAHGKLKDYFQPPKVVNA